MFRQRHWIPPSALIFAQLAHGASWVLLALVGLHADVNVMSAPALAWIHTVALGWLTTAALGILVHVVPGFTDVRWRNEGVVRFALVPFAAGTVLFVTGWFLSPRLVLIGAFIMTVAFLCYYVVTALTLRSAKHVGKTESAIANALMINLSFFLVVCLIGLTMSLALTYGWFANLLDRLPLIHANVALYGWLTMLVYGVSARTVRPICGARSRFWWMHIVVASSVLVGPVLIAIGVAIGVYPITWLGAAALGTGALCYSFDTLDIVRRATVRHRTPQAFIVASVVSLILSIFLGLGVLLGKPWSGAYLFVTLVGWVGQVVNAHFFHIGVRLIATVIRGEDDETRPVALLDGRLSWLSFIGAQASVALCCYGLLFDAGRVVAIGAMVGLGAWLVMCANAAVAATTAKSLPDVPVRLARS